MKRIFATLSVLAALLSVYSCDFCDCKPINPSDYATQWNVYNFDIKAADWVKCKMSADVDPTESEFFRVQLNVPELTEDIFNDGLVQVYAYVGGNQELLPYSYYHRDLEIDGEGHESYYFWQEKIDYDFAVGKVFLYSTSNDFWYDDDYTPGNWKFRVVLIY